MPAMLDRNMPEIGGLDLLRAIREIDPDCQVILMTGEATIDTAVDRATVERALQQVGGNRAATARRLGISRRALYRRLDTFGLR